MLLVRCQLDEELRLFGIDLCLEAFIVLVIQVYLSLKVNRSLIVNVLKFAGGGTLCAKTMSGEVMYRAARGDLVDHDSEIQKEECWS